MFLKSISMTCSTARSFGNPTAKYMRHLSVQSSALSLTMPQAAYDSST